MTTPAYESDIAVLQEIARLEESGAIPVRLHDVAKAVDVDFNAVTRCVYRLKRMGMLTGQDCSDQSSTVPTYDMLVLTEAGILRAGVWPSPETLVQQIASALEAEAASASDEPTRSKLRAAARALAGVGKEIAAATAAGVLSGQVV